ncbi:hypothetical protein NEF87_003748 [Candidatus Lokiarchaeum ossiferum]|uniref:Uncharacterized protein n=1 Tax=Candidatus Lokiarchaeum ossiferum TaxID=2951803 RepID=A0ABY6HVV0_9ARCH|nr:hypothetical protein NEF87_003748 [Candidatus Lokiarchaeum sp. B-35]
MKLKVNFARIGALLLIISFTGNVLGSLVQFEPASFNVIPRSSQSVPIIADHTIVDQVRLDLIADVDIINAKNSLHIAYGHTSHGSQVTEGMAPLSAFKEANGGTEGLYDWHDGPETGSLDLDDYFMSGDLGHNGDLAWATSTRTYLDNSANSDVNVVMWSWCGGVSDNTEEGINIYLNEMNTLESEYPDVQFVYMTGHASSSGTGELGNTHIRNQQIRDYCVTNNKILFDFYDIECYNPSGDYFGNKNVTDACSYDSDENGSLDGNWATEWQEQHTEDVDWYSCGAAHSVALNANMKAYAAWWMFAVIAGADINTATTNTDSSSSSSTSSNTDPSSTTTGEFLGMSYNTLIGAGFGLGFVAIVVTLGIVIKKQM